MKKLVLSLVALVVIGGMDAQQLNEKGLYIDSEGELFTGTISSVNQSVKNELAVKDGVISGTANYYYASGKLMESGVFENGEKNNQWTLYSEKGSILAIAYYNKGKKTGTWLVYDENGKKRYEMSYTNGDKTGVWTNWGDDGSIVSTKSYVSK
ncbi:MAG: toxin-antitoxin system YwqK family antitoxin [Bacteroidota bacterium]|nr:toxin-antitoxin system YwqK family antitoxin [Bacteroidota bacterium]